MCRTILFVLLGSFFVIFLVGCGSSVNNCPSVATENQIISVSENWSFIEFSEMPGYVDYNVDAIGNAILQWERANPNRKIVSMQFIYEQNAYFTSARVLGISIYSEITP